VLLFSRMSNKKALPIDENDLKGFKYFKVLCRLLERLHEAGCQRDRAHNRLLHMDQYMSLLLLYMFNPICESLRGIQRASELAKVQKILKVPRTSMGSLSEAVQVFDSELLREIVGELAAQLRPIPHAAKLDDIEGVLTLVDGTLLAALPKMTWALWKDEHNALKAHVQFELLKGVPVAATITEANASERAVLAENLQPGRLYVKDRGYAEYALFQKILDAGSSFVCRIQDNAVFEVVEERELSKEALAAGVVRDAVVRLGCKSRRGDLEQPVRIVQIECTPHHKPSGKTGRGGPEQGQTILIATDRLDLPPEVVGLIFRHRWQIEIFFRFFKHVLGCRHLLSHEANGIELQTYAAIIACLLIALWTGGKPTRATYEMICYRFLGWASEEELDRHIAGLVSQEAQKTQD
jgi:hypothetical protein